MAIRQTHTYATLEVSHAAYNEVEKLLRAAGYGHAFMPDGAIDMHGIALTKATKYRKCDGCGASYEGTYCYYCNPKQPGA